MSNHTSAKAAGVVVGVDTHRDEQVAVAIDQLGLPLGDLYIATTTEGYTDLERWAMSQGEVMAFGVEGTGSYGAGLARFLTGYGHTVIEVSRPDGSTRRRLGKSDPIDAEVAARAVLAGVAKGNPKAGNDSVEMLRMLKRCLGTPQAVKLTVEHVGAPLIQEKAGELLALGWADQEKIDAFVSAHREWAEHPDAFLAMPACEAVAWKE